MAAPLIIEKSVLSIWLLTGRKLCPLIDPFWLWRKMKAVLMGFLFQPPYSNISVSLIGTAPMSHA